jgi:hypothetical protein
MKSNENLTYLSHNQHLCVAELASFDFSQRIKLTLLGYQFPLAQYDDANWYRIRAEYHSPHSRHEFQTSDLDAKAFERGASALDHKRGGLLDQCILLEPPYGEELKLKLVIKSDPRNGRRFKFKTRNEGLFVEGQIGKLSFEFKTTRPLLKKFVDAIKLASGAYPIRYLSNRERFDLNPVLGLQAKFNGAPTSEEVSHWYTQIIEDGVQRRLKPLQLSIKRFLRRRKNKPKKLTEADCERLFAFARIKARKEETESWARISAR